MLDGNLGEGVNEMDPVLANGTSLIGRQTNREGSRWALVQPDGIPDGHQTNPLGSRRPFKRGRGPPPLDRSTSRTISSLRTSRILNPRLGRVNLGKEQIYVSMWYNLPKFTEGKAR